MSSPTNNKVWRDRRSQKILERKSELKRIRSIQGAKYYKSLASKSLAVAQHKKGPHTYPFVAPEVFSVIGNYSDTIQIFNGIIDRFNARRFDSTIFIDVSNVKEISVEALMYLAALIHDARSKPYFRVQIEGNFPRHGEAAKKFIASGFLSFVRTNRKDITPQSQQIQIIRGLKSDPDTAKKVCDFVQEKCNLNRIDTIPLFNVLVELMGNTFHHAYKDMDPHELSANSWYLYAEEKENKIVFAFLDTGLGIPKTVNKNWKEKIDILQLKDDSEFIRSALDGEFRTQTKEKNRGKGLPQISECSRGGLIDNVLIYSGKGCCRILKTDNAYELKEEKTRIFGTLFSWEINKKEE